MKRRVIILLALAATLPWVGFAATDASNPAPPAFTVPPDVKLSQPARDVVKMTASGVSDEVVKAYVASSPMPFNLSADNIIHMQGVGVSASVTTEMLNHDKKILDQAPPAPAPVPTAQPATPYPYPAPAAQPAEPVNTVSTYTIPADTSYYADLAPYGNWSYVGSYGWCWAPYWGVSYAYYPWNVLRCGYWWNCPGRGWLWCPRAGFHGSGFHGSAFVSGRNGFNSGFHTHFNGTGTHFNSAHFTSGRMGGFGGGVSVSHIGGGMSHFSGGTHFASSGHFSGATHFSGGGRSGGMGHR